MKASGENVRFDFRFDGAGLKLCATRDRMPERTFDLHLECENPSRHFACGFFEFVEVAETADAVLARVMHKLHDMMPAFPGEFPAAQFHDALSHWLMFNFGTPVRHVAKPEDETPAIVNGAATPIARS